MKNRGSPGIFRLYKAEIPRACLYLYKRYGLNLIFAEIFSFDQTKNTVKSHSDDTQNYN